MVSDNASFYSIGPTLLKETQMVYNRLSAELIFGEMGSWRSWFSFKNSLLHHSRAMPFKLTSFLKHKTRDNKAGLMSLYKDMEACEGYADIQVMWKIIHSSSLPVDHNREMRNKRVCLKNA